MYLPSGLRSDQVYPTLVVIDKFGDAQDSLRQWKDVAERHKWLIYASREPVEVAWDWDTMPRVKARLDQALSQFPADRTRVILTGYSTGWNFAHELNLQYYGDFAAVINNSSGVSLSVPMSTAGIERSRKVAIFLISPQDQMFHERLAEAERFYRVWGWSTEVLTYQSDQRGALPNAMQQAALLLTQHPSWMA